MRYRETELARDCTMVRIPEGTPAVIPAGTPVVITQALGDTFTLQLPTLGGLYRLAGADADAIGEPVPAAVAPAAGTEAAAAGAVEEAQVWEQLRKVYDPEIPVNIVELGLVYDLRIDPHSEGGSMVKVQMTLTAPGCGMGGVIAMDAKRLIEQIPGVREADVEVVFDPPWNQSMMSEAAKLELGFL